MIVSIESIENHDCVDRIYRKKYGIHPWGWNVRRAANFLRCVAVAGKGSSGKNGAAGFDNGR